MGLIRLYANDCACFSFINFKLSRVIHKFMTLVGLMFSLSLNESLIKALDISTTEKDVKIDYN